MIESSDVTEPVGSRLRRVREEKGLSIGTISDRLKFAPRQIEALEAGHYDQLPGRAFTRGFVRSYSRFLGLPEAEMLAQADREMPPDHAPPELPTLRGAVLPTQRRGLRLPKALLAVLAVLAIGGAGGWWGFQWLQSSHLLTAPARDNRLLMEDVPPLSEASAAEASAAPASGVPASGARASGAAASRAAASAAAPAELRFVAASWVDIRDAGGRTLFRGVGQRGRVVAIEGRPPFRIKIGKAAAVELRAAGKPVDLKPYTRGEVANLTLPPAR